MPRGFALRCEHVSPDMLPAESPQVLQGGADISHPPFVGVCVLTCFQTAGGLVESVGEKALRLSNLCFDT